jgi:hypothetical protein
VIDAAPHGLTSDGVCCKATAAFQPANRFPCTCWKSKARPR